MKSLTDLFFVLPLSVLAATVFLTPLVADTPDAEVGGVGLIDQRSPQLNRLEAKIAELQAFVVKQQGTIKTYRMLNAGLSELVQRHKSQAAAAPSQPSAELETLKKEFISLKNDFETRTSEWLDAQEQARVLENKIKRLEGWLRAEESESLLSLEASIIGGESQIDEIFKLKRALSHRTKQLFEQFELIGEQKGIIAKLEDKLTQAGSQVGSAPAPISSASAEPEIVIPLASPDSGDNIEPSPDSSTEELPKRYEKMTLEEILAQVEVPSDSQVAPKPPFEEMLWKEMVGMAHRLIKDYPQEVTPYGMLFTAARQQDDVEVKTAMLKELSAVEHTDPEFTQLVDAVNAELRKMESVGKPFEMKFTAVDGREVDLAKMKGKVVLIDFWATWCGPCVRELPNLKKAYDELHGKGFEIIGISLDEEVKELTDFVASKDVPWPQFCDGQGW